MYRMTSNHEEMGLVIVAEKDIEPLEELGPQNLSQIELPVRYIVSQGVKSLNEVSGKKAAVPIYKGEQLIVPKLNERILIPQDTERYLLLSSKGLEMMPGQKVDVYLVFESGKSQYTGVEKVLCERVVATVLDEGGRKIHQKEGLSLNQVQTGVEVIVDEEEIYNYLEKRRYAKEVIIRHAEGSE